MYVTVTGATGFIGRRLVRSLADDVHQVHALSRKARSDFGPSVASAAWDPLREDPPEESLRDADAVVHLLGEPVAQRWTDQSKRRIRESRLVSTRRLIQFLSTRSRRLKTFVCASAVGYYGSRGDEILTEESKPGRGFLPELCAEWEREADLAEALGMRVVKIRIGIVLGAGGGMLEKLVPIFRLGVGGRISSGKQWMSWIHVDDLVRLFRFALDNPVRGVLNGVSPTPATNAEFTSQLASALHRPALFPVPGFALKLAYGQMAEVILSSQRAIPRAAQAAGFAFQHAELGEAIRSAIS
jgi:uncharacterized protein